MSNEPQPKRKRMSQQRIACAALTAALAGLLVALPAAAQQDSSWDSAQRTRQSDQRDDAYSFVGPYIQAAVSIGRIDFDGSVDSDASGGFGLTGGYRLMPWIAAEAHFQLLGGEDNVELGPFERDSLFWGFTFGPKVYPFAVIENSGLPDEIQPYAFVGIGGGEIDVDGSDEESAFIGRFILGIDYWFDEHLGMFVEGGGFAFDDDDVDGVGVFSVGGSYRF
ncbi:MAG: porin family protein [bacterium]|nr:porin family protein [bacterium]